MDQQKRNISLLISLGVMALIALFLFVQGSNTSSPINPELFRLSDSKSIDRVLIEKKNSTIKLQYKPGGWRVNDSLKADNNLIDVLFATVAQAVPKRSVASRIKEAVLDSINNSGIQVTFFQGAEVDKKFTVWDDGKGLTYFSDPVDNNPYVMVIPGYRVQVSGIFVQNANSWRDKRIFNFNWRNFKELSASFPRDTKQDFTVAMNGRYFSIVGQERIDTTSLNNFLDAVSLINADQFYTPGESPTVDSLIKTSPIMGLSVKDVSDNIYSLKVFEIGKGQRNALAQWENDYVWFDRRNILPIYKKKKDFVK